MAGFHRRSGSMVTVSNNGRTAQRNHPAQEFNNGVVLSAEPLRDNHLFEVKIDRKVPHWSRAAISLCRLRLIVILFPLLSLPLSYSLSLLFRATQSGVPFLPAPHFPFKEKESWAIWVPVVVWGTVTVLWHRWLGLLTRKIRVIFWPYPGIAPGG